MFRLSLGNLFGIGKRVHPARPVVVRTRLEVQAMEERSVPSVVVNHKFPGTTETATAATPPDPDVAAGPTYVIHTANSFTSAPGVAIFTKSGTPVVQEGITDFFASGNITVASPSDARVIFNNVIGRFLVLVQDTSNGNLDYAISKDANPLDGFGFYQVNTNEVSPNTGDNLASDYPTVGFNAGGYFVTLNMFDQTTGQADHVLIVSITPAGTPLLTDRPVTPADGGPADFTLVPVRWHSSTDPNIEWFVEVESSATTDSSGNTVGTLRFVQMTNPFAGSTGAPSFADTTVAVPAFLDAGTASIVQPDQPAGVPVAPEHIDSRIIDAAMQGNTLVAVHTVNTSLTKDVTDPTQYTDRVRWYQFQVQATPVLQQVGDIAPASPFLDASTYTPAIEIAPNGWIGVIFHESSSLEFISMYVTGRLPTDPANTMQAPVLIQAGNADSPDGRIGDNAGMAVDPVDGTFWAAGERYTSLMPSWETWIANFTLTSPSVTPPQGGGGDHGHHDHGHGPDGNPSHSKGGDDDTPSQGDDDSGDHDNDSPGAPPRSGRKNGAGR